MTTTKRKLLYALVTLLFVVVLLLIGWLARVLFGLRVVPPATDPAPVASVKHQQAGSGPLSETVINIDTPPERTTGQPGQDGVVHGASNAIGTAGHIPSICEGYGPQIRSRQAFPNPLTHETVVSATRAVVTLTLNPASPRGEP